MTIEQDIRRTNAWVKRRIKPNRVPQDERPIADYEFQVPQQWRETVALWAKAMLVITAASFAAGVVVGLGVLAP